MKTTMERRGCIRIMEKNMETAIVFGSIGIMEKKMETTIIYCGHIKTLETTP